MKMVLDGELVDGEDIALSTLGRGFAYGYGVFETLHCIQGKPCFLSEHLKRLRRSAAGLGLHCSVEEGHWSRQIDTLLRANQVSEGVFKIVLCEDGGRTRSALFVRRNGPSPEPSQLRLRLSSAIRASQAFSSRNKTLNYLDLTLDLESARERGFDECVYRNEFGFLTECSLSNLFFSAGDVLCTPRVECGLLDGIARGQLIEIAGSFGLRVEEGSYTARDLLEAQCVFVSNSVVGALGAREFDDSEGNSALYESGGLVDRLAAAYRERELESIRQ